MKFRDFLFIGIVGCLFFILYIYHLDYNFYNYDEGVNLYASWELSQGRFPYRDFFFVYFPSIHIVLGGIFKKFGVSIFLARFLSVMFAFFTAFWVFYFSFRLSKKFFPALFSFSIFLLNTYTLLFARAFIPVFFWLFFALTSIFWAHKFLISDKKSALLLAGAFIGISMYIKLLALAFFISIILVLLLRRGFNAGIYFITGFCLTFVPPVAYIVIKFYPQVWEMAFKFHFLQKEHYLFATLQNLFQHNFYVFILGLPFVLKYRWKRNPFYDLLFFSTLVLFLLPIISGKFIWVQYFYPLLAFFSIFSSCWVEKMNKFNLYSLLTSILLFLSVKYYTERDIRYFQGWRKYDIATTDLVEFIKEHTKPQDYILCEFLHINILAGRENPPQLADVSHTRIISQKISVRYVIDICEKYKVKILIYPVRAIPFRMDLIASQPEFKKYLREKFYFLGNWRRNHDVLRVFVRKK